MKAVNAESKEHRDVSWFPSQSESTPFPFQHERDFLIVGNLYKDYLTIQEQSSWTKNNPLGFSLRPQREQSSLSVFLVSNNPENKDTIVCLICIRI